MVYSLGIAPHGAFFRGRAQVRYNYKAMSRFINYLKDTRVELAHVSWPTQKQAAVYTALVVAISLVIAVLLGLFDFLFARALDWFLGF